MHRFGVDHWSTFAYAEEQIVNHRGIMLAEHMRTDRLRHPVADAGKVIPSSFGYPTRLRAQPLLGQITDPLTVVEIPNHDDWDCLDDLRAAGLLDASAPQVDDDGWYLDVNGRRITAHGDGLRPESLTGLGQQHLALHYRWSLTGAGQAVALALRAHKAAGGSYASFTPPAAAQDHAALTGRLLYDANRAGVRAVVARLGREHIAQSVVNVLRNCAVRCMADSDRLAFLDGILDGLDDIDAASAAARNTFTPTSPPREDNP